MPFALPVAGLIVWHNLNMDVQINTIEDLGYDDFFEASRQDLDLDDFCIARVIAEHRGAYRVKTGDTEYLATITGKKSFHYSMTQREKRQKEKDFGKFLKAAKNEMKRRGHRGYGE